MMLRAREWTQERIDKRWAAGTENVLRDQVGRPSPHSTGGKAEAWSRRVVISSSQAPCRGCPEAWPPAARPPPPFGGLVHIDR